jgi:hypothetical protein
MYREYTPRRPSGRRRFYGRFDRRFVIPVNSCVFFNGMTVFRWEGALLLTYFGSYTAYILRRATERDALHGLVVAVTWIVLPVTVATLLVMTATNPITLTRNRAGKTCQGLF